MNKQFSLPVLLILFVTNELNAQNVGIGTPSPAFKLDVQGRIRVKAGVLNNVNTSSGIWFDDYRNGNNRLFFGMKDSIRGGFYGSGVGWDLLFNSQSGIFSNKFRLNGPFSFHSGTTDYMGGSMHSDSNDIYINAKKAIASSSQGNLVLQLTDPRNPTLLAGNVGIGIDSPYYKFSLRGDMAIYDDNDFIGFIGNQANNLMINARLGNVITGSSSGHLILQHADGLSATSGRVGIGINAPTEKLEVNGNIKSTDVKLTGEVNALSSGAANMIPIAYGRINADGSIASGTGNFTVFHAVTGVYNISVSGLTNSNGTAIVTPWGATETIRTASVFINFENVMVETTLLDQVTYEGNVVLVKGKRTDFDFTFVVYRL